MVRVVVVGARRRRQGIGEFVAREFSAAGAAVCGVVGSTEERARETAAGLSQQLGSGCRGYGDLARALETERPDVVAICSPFPMHAEHLRSVLGHGCHCLCEKPLVWSDAPSSPSSTEIAEEIVEAFIREGRYLALLTQWPQTLPFFDRLHPEVRKGGRVPREFTMRMSPVHGGEGMVLDSVSHPLSMIQHLVGCGVITDIEATFASDRRDLHLQFGYRHARGCLSVSCRFCVVEEPPRPASYGIDGRVVSREIQLPDYEMFFSSEGRRIGIEDPLRGLIRSFLEGVEGGAPVARRELIEGVRGLELLYEAVRTG